MADGRSEYVEEDSIMGMLEEWLSTLVPDAYKRMAIPDRVSWRRDEAMGIQDTPGVQLLDSVCIAQLWAEMLERKPGTMSRIDSLDLSRALRELGWEPDRRTCRFRFYGPQRAFTRPANGGLI